MGPFRKKLTNKVNTSLPINTRTISWIDEMFDGRKYCKEFSRYFFIALNMSWKWSRTTGMDDIRFNINSTNEDEMKFKILQIGIEEVILVAPTRYKINSQKINININGNLDYGIEDIQK